MRELGQKLLRVLAMSPLELRVRTAEQWRGWNERLATVIGLARSNPLPHGFKDGRALALLRQFQSRSFYSCRAECDSTALKQSFRELFPGRTDAIAEEAELICVGSLRLFGGTVTFADGKVDWHLDWKTGQHFPVKFYRDIVALDRNRQADIKRVWETNRQQFLLTLGKAYLLTRKQNYAQCAVRMIESWIHFNPPYRGVNWKEGLEEAVRVLSWIWTLRMIADADALTEESCRRILGSLALQLNHIEQHLSLYSSPNTHLLGEALALVVVGLAFPSLGPTRRGVPRALRILEEQLEQQVAADGSHREKAAYYHCYALDMYLLATILGRQHGVKFSPGWMKRVEKMAEFLLAILRPDGSLARFGDDDGGRTVQLSDKDYYNPRALLALAATLFERGDLKRAAGELPEEVFWILGPAGALLYTRLEEKEPEDRTMWFENAKLGIMRTGWLPDDLWLASQAQPMGMLTAGHSHAGLLSFELSLGGKNVIVDPGTYTYRMGGPWREQFRGMQAHNVVQIDEKHWYASAGPFRWERMDSVHPLSLNAWPRHGLRVGYRARDAAGQELQHVRTFVAESARAVWIHDHFKGVGKHRLTFWLHFAPGCHVRRKEPYEFEIEFGDTTVRLVLNRFGDFHWQVFEGSEDPPAGWVSPCFDQRVQAPTLYIEDEADFPAEREMRVRTEPSPRPEVTSSTNASKQEAEPRET